MTGIFLKKETLSQEASKCINKKVQRAQWFSTYMLTHN